MGKIFVMSMREKILVQPQQCAEESFEKFPPTHPAMGSEEPTGAGFLVEEEPDFRAGSSASISSRVHQLQLAVSALQVQVKQMTADLQIG